MSGPQDLLYDIPSAGIALGLLAAMFAAYLISLRVFVTIKLDQRPLAALFETMTLR